MTDYLIGLALGLFVALFAVAIAWESAHKTVATECEKLGAFYVGTKVYQCSEKK
jgi:hypothetical protein